MLESAGQVAASVPTEDDRIRRLRDKHRTFDARLQQLDAHIALTSEEQLERKRLQKLKLLCKDQIALLRRAGR